MPAAQHPDHHGILRYFLSGVYLAPDAVCKQDACPAPVAQHRTRSGLSAVVFEERLERVKGFEPSTPTLARLCSTPELHPRLRYGPHVPALIAFQGYNAGHLPLQGVNAGSGELAINLAQKSGMTRWQTVPRRTFLTGPTRWMSTGWGTGCQLSLPTFR